jgi:iron complex transport system substrate-binding protein
LLAQATTHATLAAAAATLLLAANLAAQTPSPQLAPPHAQPSPRAAFREVTDEAGRIVRVPAEVRRIVSLAPNLTETLYALGAQERLVGVTDYCDYPPEAKTKPRIGGPVNPSLEHIVALKPDLVLMAATANRRETLQALERLNIPVYGTSPRTVEAVLESTRHLAELLGAGEQGETLVAELRARLGRLRQQLAGRAARRVLFVVWHEPLVSIGRNTFLADALRWAGAVSALEIDTDWPRLNLEEVVRVQPEFLVFASSHSEGAARAFDSLRERPGWRKLEAVRAGRYAVISDAVNRPSPRLVDAIEQLARQLHPDAFEEKSENGKGKRENEGRAMVEQRFPLSVFYFPVSVFAFHEANP